MSSTSSSAPPQASTLPGPPLYAASAATTLPLVQVQQVVEVERAVADVQVGVGEVLEHEGLAAAEVLDRVGGVGRDLHQAPGARVGRLVAETGLVVDDPGDQGRIDVVALGLLADDVVVASGSVTSLTTSPTLIRLIATIAPAPRATTTIARARSPSRRVPQRRQRHQLERRLQLPDRAVVCDHERRALGLLVLAELFRLALRERSVPRSPARSARVAGATMRTSRQERPPCPSRRAAAPRRPRPTSPPAAPPSTPRPVRPPEGAGSDSSQRSSSGLPNTIRRPDRGPPRLRRHLGPQRSTCSASARPARSSWTPRRWTAWRHPACGRPRAPPIFRTLRRR